MNQEKIVEWVQIFLRHLQERTVATHVAQDEGYKFQNVNHFLTHINLDEPDLAGNLEHSIINDNLVVAAMYFPRKMLLIYAALYPEETRALLKNLFDEERDVAERINQTTYGFAGLEERRSKETSSPKNNTYIGLRFLSLLLGYMHPNKYNPLKPAEWKVFARFVNPSFSMPNHTTPGEQYKIYCGYIEPLREYIGTRPELLSLRDELVKGLSFNDSALRWLTQDVIFVTARAFAYQKAQEVLPIMQQNESADTDVEEYASPEQNDTGFMALEAHLEEYMVRNWSHIDFGEPLTLYVDEDGTTGQQYTTDVGVLDILAKDKDDNFVVIELKRAEYGYRVVGQVLNYIGWVSEKLATDGQTVRGMIVVGSADKTLRSAVKPVASIVSLKEYRVSMHLKTIK